MNLTQSLTDSISIAEEVLVVPLYEGATSSLFGTFLFGQRKFGMNVTVLTYLTIEETSLIKFNGTFIKSLFDDISFSETLSRVVAFKIGLSDTLSLNDGAVHEFSLSLQDSQVVSESISKEPGPRLSDSIDFETLIEISFAEAILFKSKWKFKIKNPSTGDFIANIVNARGRYFVERLNDESEAGFVLDADDGNCNSTILNLGVNELYIYYGDTLMWGGQLVSAQKTANGNEIVWKVLAKDWVALLGKRFCGVTEPREFTTTDAGQIAKTLIQETQALTNGSFGITYGTIETSITRSPTYDKKNILDAIKEMANAGDDGSPSYGYDFEITPLKVFNVYYPYKGTIRQNILFRYPGNCETFEAYVDTWGIINQEWGLGQHWTGNTSIVSRSDVTSQVTYKRREAIKNYRDVSVLEFLQDMVYQDIQWLKDPSTVVKFVSRVDDNSRITDYNVGDGVSVVCDSFDINEWLWIYERKIEIEDNDELKVTLTVGD